MFIYQTSMATTGRPSSYKPEYVDKADEYLLSCQDEDYRLVKTDGANSTTYENKIKVNLPSIEGFSAFINHSVKSLYNWADENPLFLQALEKIKREQKEILIKKGLSGDYNPTIAKLVLSSNHGMSEKSEVDHTTKGEQITGIEFIVPTDVKDSN